MFKKPDFVKKSEIITNLLIFAIAVVLASEIYTLVSHIMRTEHAISIIPFRIAVICVILVLAMLLRKTEISLLREYGAKKEQLYKTTIEDISEKLADEEMLLKEYKDAIDKSAIVSKTDKNGIITYVNQRFCEVTGYSKEELIGKTHKLVRHPDNDRRTFHTMWLKLLSKKTYHGKIQNIDKQGRTFFVEATITPILDSDNEVEEFIAIMFDVTKETLLEKSILEKTAKEQEESYKEELNRAKESFLLIFTHELKTPLNAIINFSSFVKKRIEKEDIEDKNRLLDLLSSVKQNGEDMLFSVTNMLDTAKLTSKKMVFANSVFELGMLLEDVKQKILPPSDIKCETNIQSDIFIKSDRLRVEQIVSNIISNAIKYGNGEIAITLGSAEERFVLCIEDNGIGVKNKESLFELFASSGSDTTRASKGTGIGLYFAKMLCDEFGFEITVSDANKLSGARFCVSGPTTTKVEK